MPAYGHKVHRGNFCGQFGEDAFGQNRSSDEPDNTARALAEAWSLLEHSGMIAPEPNDSTWFFVTRRGLKAAENADAYKQEVLRFRLPPTAFHHDLRGAAYDAFVRGNFQ